jgi:two-component system chemotaxis response regulator CheB
MLLGALDCLLKPSTLSGGAETFREDLFWKLKTIQNATPLARLASRSHATPSTATPKNTISLHKNIMTFNGKPDILAIGCSTGGPVALQKLIPYLKGVNIPVVITQHMPATFTKIFAENLEKQTGIPCSEGIDGEALKAGHIYIAPGNYHMILERNNGIPTIRLNQNPPENFCRPAVDPMFRSVVEVYNNRILAVILTGMGQDGLEGSRAIVKNNGKLIAQNEASSVVWGMPGAVAKAGICSEIMDLEQMGAWLRNTLQIR